jgi:hypothetical protein
LFSNLAEINKYRFSFTAASLLLNELVAFSKMIVEEGIQLEDLKPELMNRERSKTNKREFAELFLRLKVLDGPLMEKLVYGTQDDQKQIAIVAFGRTYDFFKDFIEEVVLEKMSLFDFKLEDRDYNSFINRKYVEHEELDHLADTTKQKIKQVLFKVMEQGGLIDNIKDKNIIRPVVDRAVERVVFQTNPRDLKLLLYSEQTIIGL